MPALGISFIRSFVLTAAAQLLVVTPVVAQSPAEPSISLPEGSPWWAIIAVSAAGVVFWFIRRYFEQKFDQQKAALAAQVKAQADAEKERERRFELELERLRGERAQEQATSEQIKTLSSSILAMATSITDAYTSLSTDRENAARERQEFRRMLDENTHSLKANSDEIARLRDEVNKLVLQSAQTLSNVEVLQERIGQTTDGRTLMAIMNEIFAEVRRAVEAMQRAELTSASAAESSAPPVPANGVTTGHTP